MQISNDYLAIKDVEALGRTSLGLEKKLSALTEVGCPVLKETSDQFAPAFHPRPLPAPTHAHWTANQRKGQARWLWGLATRKGPSFTSRLLLNSSADWQRYKIWAIWELFGSLGPVPNEQVLTWKKLPAAGRCRRGAAIVTGVCRVSPSPASHPRNQPLAQLCTASQDVCLPAGNQSINRKQELWSVQQLCWFYNLPAHFKNSLHCMFRLNQIEFGAQEVSMCVCITDCKLH